MKATVSVHKSNRQGLNWVVTVIDERGNSTVVTEQSAGMCPGEAAGHAISYSAKYNGVIIGPKEVTDLIPNHLLFTK